MRRRRPRIQGGIPAIAAVAAPFGRDLDRCLESIERTLKHAQARGADLVVFPEAALGGYLYEPIVAAGPSNVGAPPALRPDGDEIARSCASRGRPSCASATPRPGTTGSTRAPCA